MKSDHPTQRFAWASAWLAGALAAIALGSAVELAVSRIPVRTGPAPIALRLLAAIALTGLSAFGASRALASPALRSSERMQENRWTEIRAPLAASRPTSPAL